MKPESYEPGTVVHSKLTGRTFIILAPIDDGYYKARPLHSTDPDEVEQINANAIHAYWDVIGKE